MPKQETHSRIIQPDDPLAIAAMILGAVSFTGLGFIAGIPAIILASVALARKTQSRSLSFVGLIAGIVSTTVSIAIVLFFIFIAILAASNPDPQAPAMPTPANPQPFSQSRV